MNGTKYKSLNEEVKSETDKLGIEYVETEKQLKMDEKQDLNGIKHTRLNEGEKLDGQTRRRVY